MTDELRVVSGADARRFIDRLGRLVESPLAWQVAGLLIGLAVVDILHLTGAGKATYATLVVMGFDPDRARLIEALTFAALGAGAAAIVTGRHVAAILVAFASVAMVVGRAFFEETIISLGGAVPHAAYDPAGWIRLGLAAGHTFVKDVSAALSGHPVQSGFDPVGYVATVLSLAVMTLAIGWSATVLSREVRRWLRAGAGLVRDASRRRAIGRREAIRTALPVVAVVLVLVALPTFADMINYTPDVAMTHQGMAAAVPLVGGAAAPAVGSSSAEPAVVGGTTTSATTSRGPLPTGIVTPATAISAAQSWKATAPAGHGTVQLFSFPSPWVGGNYTQSRVWVYLPAGYATSPQRYPTVYLVPWDLAHWELGAHLTTTLDTLISKGSIPPMIVVFMDLNGGPFPNSECANSFDGRQHADTYVSDTVVQWVDTHFRTIASAAARTIMGFSQGAFCAANLQMRHPDVFANAISFSGYFVAGFRSGDTVNAWRPWGNDPTTIAANSPVKVAAALPQTERQKLFVVLSADPSEKLYGSQAVAYASVLQKNGYATDLLWNSLGHAWVEVRTELPQALQAVAERMVATGVLR